MPNSARGFTFFMLSQPTFDPEHLNCTATTTILQVGKCWVPDGKTQVFPFTLNTPYDVCLKRLEETNAVTSSSISNWNALSGMKHHVLLYNFFSYTNLDPYNFQSVLSTNVQLLGDTKTNTSVTISCLNHPNFNITPGISY